MTTFTVVIEEVLAQPFDLEASSPEEALEIACTRYRAGDYVLEPGETQDVRLCVLDERGLTDGWEQL